MKRNFLMNLINNLGQPILGLLWLSMILIKRKIDPRLKMLRKLFGDYSSIAGGIRNYC